MGAFNENGFGETSFQSRSSYGTWERHFSFTFEAGATVYVTPTITATIPDGTFLRIYIGETENKMTLVTPGIENYILFESGVSGSTLLYVKIEMESYAYGSTPSISALSILIHQVTTLYSIAKQVLIDGLSGLNTDHYVDPTLQKLPIAYAWLKSMSHRKALAQTAEAAGGVCYQGRDGTVRLEAGTWITNKANDDPVFNITNNRIIEMSSPVNEVRNSVEITTMPYVAQSNTTVWTLSSDKTLTSGQTKTYTASFSYDAVVNCVASITGTGATITSSKFYFNKAEITVHATNAVTIGLSITGNPLIVTGSQVVSETDGESIRRYGKKSLVINENNLIQTGAIAELIAESAVEVMAEQLRDIEIDWRGDPTLELGDVGLINGTKCAIVSQELDFNGALSGSMKLRRL